MAELHVLCKVDTLPNDILGQDFENHVRERFAIEHVAADELCKNVELIGVHVRDALNYPTSEKRLKRQVSDFNADYAILNAEMVQSNSATFLETKGKVNG